jgi:hypothetical protein
VCPTSTPVLRVESNIAPSLPRDIWLEGEDENGRETREHFVAWPIIQGAIHRTAKLRRGYSNLATINRLQSHGRCIGYDIFLISKVTGKENRIGSILWIDGMWERVKQLLPDDKKVSCTFQTGDRFHYVDEAILNCLQSRDSLDKLLEGVCHAAA